MLDASIIIRVKNEKRHLGETLEAVLAQRLRNLEVIVVDSGSTDGTLEIAQRFPVRLLQIKPQEFTYGYALNLGARAAHGRYLVSLSAHATPQNDVWLESLLAGFVDSSVAGTYSRIYTRPGAFLYQRLLVRLFYGPFPWTLTTYASFHNTSSAIRHDLWHILPFDEDMPGGEDQSWARRARAIGYRIIYTPESKVWHSHEGENLWRFARRTWLVDWRGLSMIALNYLRDRGLDLREQREKLRVANWQDARHEAE